MLNIAKYPDQILRQTAKKVVDFDADLKKLTEEMAQSMYEDDGVGLAAPQVSVSKRVIVIGQPDKKSFLTYINPEISFFSKDQAIGEEGCLSLPKIFGLVKRAKKIHIKYQDLSGQIQKEKIKGFLAVVLQHEIDHLNGILFIDRAEKITEGQEILDQLKQKLEKK
ncbi:peptide deformylase [Candidatus Nomurabacteria bacterium]|nr:peptide deformylase [Candidatus Nomurabacteria bacterium]